MLHTFFCYGEYVDPSKRWNQSTRVLISVKPINKDLNQSLLLFLPLKEDDPIPSLEKKS